MRRTSLLAVVLLAAAVFVAGELVAPASAPAAPAAPTAGPDGGTNAALEAKLDAAVRAYNDAKGRYDAARRRQAELTAQAAATEVQIAAVGREVDAAAVAAYKGGRIQGLTVLLGSSSVHDFLDRATRLQAQLRRDARTLRDLRDLRTRLVQQRAAIDGEVATQRKQLATMDARRKQAETALADAKGGTTTTGPSGGTASATPAPRNPDGTWPAESCSVKDPTTSGCITPRMLHAYQEARKAGFTHYTSCHRNGGSGEHPKGRACDFSANASTFVDARATGADKAYGDRLAAWLLANADRLAVLYVIWYKRIWLPSSGWKSYSGDGTPAGDHYNHVHLSVQ
jgi:peptidoglycan DL-endopeptidase CwlO